MSASQNTSVTACFNMQHNEVDALLASSGIGLGTPELWQRLSTELDGKTQLEKPHVSKKVLLKAIRMQTDAMRYLIDEFNRLQDKISDMEREAKNSQKHVERVNAKVLTLSGQYEEVTTKINELDVKQTAHDEHIKQMDQFAAQVEAAHQEIVEVQHQVVACNANHSTFVDKMEQDLVVLREDQEVTKQFALQLEDRLNQEEKELFLTSDHILHNQLSLSMWMEQNERDSKRKDDAIKEFSDKMNKQAKNVQDMMLETRRALDDNTVAVEDVQRLLLLKADRSKVDEVIESKYEEICNQLDKALASVISEEDEFKRVSQELQQIVTLLGESKADKKDLLAIKEQVLYDSRVRQQVENLRSFIDLKMNREDVFSALKNKADKEEIIALLKGVSDSMNASIQQAQRTFTEAESAFLTGKGVTMPMNQKRGNQLPSLEKERCLSCNSVIKDAPGTHQHTVNKNTAHVMAPVFGGGFAVPLSRPIGASSNVPDASGRTSSFGNAQGIAGGRAGVPIPNGVVENSSEGFLLGIDGHVYQADPDVIAQLQERTPSKAGPVYKIPQAVAAQRRNISPAVEDDDGS